MKHERQATVEYHTCDYCGAELTETDIDDGRISITMRHGDDVSFEWWSYGDYCHDCSCALHTAIIEAIPVPERYSSSFRDRDERLNIEKALIKKSIEEC